MKKDYVMGNSAIALGALSAGVKVVCGYPGTPSTEIIETIFRVPHDNVHLEWSVNEKVAMEVATSAAYSGARSLVTMKQVGLNVASDPLMSLAYVGVKGGMVIVVADDPGPISSQTEQDTRAFANFCRIPVFDPASPEQAFQMVQDAFLYSEKYHTPVILRPTTRVCHAYASIEFNENYCVKPYEGFVKDSSKWVIFPKLSFANHAMIEKRNVTIGNDFSSYKFNCVTNAKASSKKAVIATGDSYAYAKEALLENQEITLIQVGTPHPLPENFLLKALEGIDDVLCIEELSPYIENEVLRLCGKHHLKLNVYGKNTSHVALSGENSVQSVKRSINKFLGIDKTDDIAFENIPNLPIRPPVLCAGCPHRAAFYAVKVAMKNKKSYFCGDIGCYTLGNAEPLDMVDTCLCMGGGVTMSQGFNFVDKEATSFAFIGDSTFFASGLTGVVNAVYNEANVIICILDNSTTAMTGHQPHPGTGFNLMGNFVDKVDISKVLEGIGVNTIVTVNPLDFKASVDAVKDCASIKGVKVIIFKAPCISIVKPHKPVKFTQKCNSCRVCIKKLGCPAIIMNEGKVAIDTSLCVGCNLCAQICPRKSIEESKCE